MDNKFLKLTRYLALSIALLVLIVWSIYIHNHSSIKTIPQPKIHGLFLDKPRSIPFFSLQSSQVHIFTEQSLKNHWSLLFFGYTACPDLCPTTLTTLNETVNKLPKTLKKQTQIIFISVDPQRDSIARITQYVHYFNPNFIGLTGSSKQLKTLALSLGIPYWVHNQQEKGNYLVDHGSMIAVTNPHGQYQGFFSAPHDASTIANELNEMINYYNLTT